MRKILKIILLFFLVLFSINAKAQHFDTLLKKLQVQYPQEKVYLQFDRSFYNPGETIWFKAYLFSGNFPSEISKTLYTELIDSNGNVIQRTSMPVIMSVAAGSLQIPIEKQGPFYVRSYTKWMLNFDSSYIYRKEIYLPASQKPTAKLIALSETKRNPDSTSSEIIVQFFPEGGDLVQNVESRVAFKATDAKGMPVQIEGNIFDDSGKKITSFFSVHDGMGTFLLLPQAHEKYKAVWKDSKQKNFEKYLPIAKQNGIVLQVDNLGNNIEFNIKHSLDEAATPFVYIVAQMNQQLIYKAKVNIDKNPSVIGLIPTKNIRTGILQITVFNPEEQPVAERITFVNSNDYSFPVHLNTIEKNLGSRKKNTIEIEVPDTLFSNLSIAITDADLDVKHQDDNIYSHLLLTSDIKGFVYNPAYYFSSDADSVGNYLDLVMMTNGWRRFKWENVLAGYFPQLNFLPENYLSFEGRIHGKNKDLNPGTEINGILELKNHSKDFLNIPVKPDGTFNFSGMIFYDTAKLFYQFNKNKKNKFASDVRLDIKDNLLFTYPFLEAGHSLLFTSNNYDTPALKKSDALYQEQLKNIESQKFKLLKTVVVENKKQSKKELLDKEYTSGFFSDRPGSHNRTILPEDDAGFLSSRNLLSYLQSRVAGLQITLDATQDAIKWRGFVTSLFIDEISQREAVIDATTHKPIIVEDAANILSIPMSEIAMVKIFEPPFFGAGEAGPGGAIAVYLKKGFDDNQKGEMLNFCMLPGYSPVKEFYSPDYSVSTQSDMPDYRRTLYWNPTVITDKNHHKISISFYNNDITKNMKVIVEGCNENGKLTHVEKVL